MLIRYRDICVLRRPEVAHISASLMHVSVVCKDDLLWIPPTLNWLEELLSLRSLGLIRGAGPMAFPDTHQFYTYHFDRLSLWPSGAQQFILLPPFNTNYDAYDTVQYFPCASSRRFNKVQLVIAKPDFMFCASFQ